MRSQKRWFKRSDYAQYERDCDIADAIESLSKTYQYTTEESDFEITDNGPIFLEESFLLNFDPGESISETLELLSLQDLKTISSLFKTSSRSKRAASNGQSNSVLTKNKSELIKDLIAVSTQSSVSSFFQPSSAEKSCLQPSKDAKSKIITEAKKIFGKDVIKLNPFVYQTISRAFVIYFRGKDFETNFVEAALLSEMSLMNFPNYKIKRSQKYFSSRRELIDFEEAVNLRFEVDALMANKASDRRKQLADDLFKKLESKVIDSLYAAAYYDEGVASSPALAHPTPESISVRAILLLCAGMVSDHVAEWKFLNTFLNQRLYHKAQRGKAYIRKAMLEMNSLQKEFDFSQELCEMKDKDQFEQYLIVEYYKQNPISGMAKKRKVTRATALTPPVLNIKKEGIDNASDELLASAMKLFWSRRALETCVRGLEDATVHEVYHIDLKKRITKLEKYLKIPIGSRHDFSHFVLKLPEHRTIQCDRIVDEAEEATINYPNYNFRDANFSASIGATVTKSNTFKRPTWVDVEGTREAVFVEEAALSFYRTLGWDGMHSENSMLATLFALLFWDIMWSTVRSSDTGQVSTGIFEHHCQSFPLDLFSKNFYFNRKEDIDARLKKIKTDMDFVKKQIKDVYNQEATRKTVSIGVTWYPLNALHAISEGLGTAALASICEILSKDYRVMKSGMPDLCLYKTEPSECMFSEVKSEFDVLSDKQCYWIDILVNAGVKVEVCHVLEPKSYVKKIKLS
jgi:Fanconi-associated nuclease 1